MHPSHPEETMQQPLYGSDCKMLAKGKTTTFPSRVQAVPLHNEEQCQTESIWGPDKETKKRTTRETSNKSFKTFICEPLYTGSLNIPE